ncbi:MAG: PDDEXK nuclease domain-containing protein [Chitinophagales bacterium]|nr:PDDEXK nuclease domain-containing protein [Chitinophagales bacterium]
MRKELQNKDFEHIILLIEKSRENAYRKVNEELIVLYFKVGKIVSDRVAAGEWGEGTVDELARFIQQKYPGLKGFNRRGLYRMKQFYELYAPESEVYRIWKNTMAEVYAGKTNDHDETKFVSTGGTHLQDADIQYNKFVSTVLTQISWSNHRLIFSKAKTPEEKLYYLALTIRERYGTRELERALNTAHFERTMLSNRLISSTSTPLPQNYFKDPYIFEFLDLPDGPSEGDLEKALIRNLQKFILEIGKGFTYMGHQYRLQVGNKDYYTDLLFYHRDMQCLVLFELKMQEFEPEFLGKLNFYLEALDRDVKRPFEKPSIGVLLCKGKDTEVVEYAMARNTSPAIIAEFETKWIPKSILANKLHQLVEQLSLKHKE